MKRVNRILILIPENIAGGAERVLTILANEFSNIGLKVYFMSFDSTSCFYPLNESVKILRLNTGTRGLSKIKKFLILPYLEIARVVRMKRNMKEINPDVCISFMFTTNMLGWFCCKQLGIPIILSERNDPNQYPKWKQILMKMVYSNIDGLVCQSDVVKNQALRGYRLKQITVIPNPLTREQISIKHYPKKKKKIISVGRLITQKNQALLIDAFSEITSKFPDYCLFIYGEGPLRNELEEQIKRNGMTDRIFMPGVELDVIKKNADAQLFVLPSNFEGYPNVLVEAMANGIPCISSRFPSGVAENLIIPGVNGFLFGVNDKNELVACMESALGDIDSLNLLGEKGRKVCSDLTAENIALRWISFIEQCI